MTEHQVSRALAQAVDPATRARIRVTAQVLAMTEGLHRQLVPVLGRLETLVGQLAREQEERGGGG